MLTEMSNRHFSERLFYADNVSLFTTATPYYNGNISVAQMIDCMQNSGRLHEWEEENRLRFVLGEKFAGYYGYDANGERVYKLTATNLLRTLGGE